MFSILRRLFSRNMDWNSFDGTQESFPAYHGINGLPIAYEVRLKDSAVVKVALVEIDNAFFRNWENGDRIPTESIEAWRWTKESTKKIGL
mgnify:CR=1 FL=1